MAPPAEGPLAEYDGYYRKSDRFEIEPARFEKALDRGDDGAWGVGALVVDDGRGLFVREGDLWLLPGGRLEEGERLAAGARREVLEETEVEVEITGLGAVAEQTFIHRETGASYEFRFATFVARPVGSAATTPENPDDHAIDEIEWFETIPEETFDRDLVSRLFEAYV